MGEVQHELFETKCELEQIRPKLEINDAVKAKVCILRTWMEIALSIGKIDK